MGLSPIAWTRPYLNLKWTWPPSNTTCFARSMTGSKTWSPSLRSPCASQVGRARLRGWRNRPLNLCTAMRSWTLQRLNKFNRKLGRPCAFLSLLKISSRPRPSLKVRASSGAPPSASSVQRPRRMRRPPNNLRLNASVSPASWRSRPTSRQPRL